MIKEPTDIEYEQMYAQKTTVVAEVDGLTYSSLQMLSTSTGIPFETLAGRALFLGLGAAIKEIQDAIGIKE